MLRSERVELRCSLLEKEQWSVCAGGTRNLSDWLRGLANAASEPAEPAAEDPPASSPPSGTPSPAVTELPSPPALVAPQAPTKPKSSGTPSTVYASERPRAKKARTGFCVHRRRVDEFCPRCD